MWGSWLYVLGVRLPGSQARRARNLSERGGNPPCGIRTLHSLQPEPGEPTFGSLLRTLRLEARLSQEALAERARISVQAVSALERGARSAPQRQTLALIADALELRGERRGAFEAAAAGAVKRRVRTGAPRPILGAREAAPADALVGRAADIAAAGDLIASHRCVTLWGTGGVGKTSLAIQVSRAVAERFAGGVFFVDLVPVDDARFVASAVAAACGVPEQPGRDVCEALARALATSPALVVLDNCEHVLSACAALVTRLVASSSATFACTSREPLRIPGERVYAVDGLHVPGPGATAESIAREPSARLFVERARSAGAELDGSEAELDAVATIVRRLEGIPLGIELAAARAVVLTPAQIARALEEPFRVLATGGRTAPERHRTLANVFAWSYALLGEPERVALRRLAVFAGRWTLDDASAVGGTPDRWETLRLVSALAEKALIAVSTVHAAAGAERRYRMPETTRQLALERLDAEGERSAAERARAERYRDAAEHGREAWRRSGDDAPFRALDPDNVRGALHWAITLRHDPVLGATLAGSLGPLWFHHGFEVEGVRWIDAALDALGSLDARAAAEAWLGRGLLATRLSLHRDAYDAARRARAFADAGGSARQRASSRLAHADAAARIGALPESRAAVEDARPIVASLGDPGMTRMLLAVHGAVATAEGDYAEARTTFAELAALYRDDAAPWWVAHGLNDLAEAEYATGDARSAAGHARDALAIARRLDAPQALLISLLNVAAYELDDGDAAAAAGAAREALAIASAGGYGVLGAVALQIVAGLVANAGGARDAAALLGAADASFERGGVRRGFTEQRVCDRAVAAALDALGASAFDRARDDGARAGEAAAIARAIGLISPSG